MNQNLVEKRKMKNRYLNNYRLTKAQTSRQLKEKALE